MANFNACLFVVVVTALISYSTAGVKISGVVMFPQGGRNYTYIPKESCIHLKISRDIYCLGPCLVPTTMLKLKIPRSNIHIEDYQLQYEIEPNNLRVGEPYAASVVFNIAHCNEAGGFASGDYLNTYQFPFHLKQNEREVKSFNIKVDSVTSDMDFFLNPHIPTTKTSPATSTTTTPKSKTTTTPTTTTPEPMTTKITTTILSKTTKPITTSTTETKATNKEITTTPTTIAPTSKTTSPKVTITLVINKPTTKTSSSTTSMIATTSTPTKTTMSTIHKPTTTTPTTTTTTSTTMRATTPTTATTTKPTTTAMTKTIVLTKTTPTTTRTQTTIPTTRIIAKLTTSTTSPKTLTSKTSTTLSTTTTKIKTTTPKTATKSTKTMTMPLLMTTSGIISPETETTEITTAKSTKTKKKSSNTQNTTAIASGRRDSLHGTLWLVSTIIGVATGVLLLCVITCCYRRKQKEKKWKEKNNYYATIGSMRKENPNATLATIENPYATVAINKSLKNTLIAVPDDEKHTQMNKKERAPANIYVTLPLRGIPPPAYVSNIQDDPPAYTPIRSTAPPVYAPLQYSRQQTLKYTTPFSFTTPSAPKGYKDQPTVLPNIYSVPSAQASNTASVNSTSIMQTTPPLYCEINKDVVADEEVKDHSQFTNPTYMY